MTSFVLKCIQGENGGLRQIFHLEVYNIGKFCASKVRVFDLYFKCSILFTEKEHLQVNVTALDAPIFTVENLPHNTAFTLNAFSSNAKGRSDSVTLRTATSAHAEKHTTNGKSETQLVIATEAIWHSPQNTRAHSDGSLMRGCLWIRQGRPLRRSPFLAQPSGSLCNLCSVSESAKIKSYQS